ncbi:MAG: RHS repeat protein [Leadbetterella sp.]|nr:RHS repeat protein [Leadbetterella sp.]
MKKTLFVLIMLSLSISCQKPEPVVEPTETTCLIEKIAYDDGTYEIYKFDANKKLSSVVITYLDENDKIVETEMKFEYNSSGNLLKTTSPNGWIDNYNYDTNGLLTKVVFLDDKGEVYEEFTVTMDAQKRLSKVVAKTGLSGVYEYKGQDNALSKLEVSYEGKVLDLYELTAFETDKSKKEYGIPITGHIFDPTVFTSSMVYYPFNISPNLGLPTKGIASTSYDENWENITDKLRVYYEFTATRKYNSNNFVTELASNDIIEKKTYSKTYSYSNCN